MLGSTPDPTFGRFQLGVAIGSRASEQALLASHLGTSGYLHVAKYLKTARLLMYRALAGDRECSRW